MTKTHYPETKDGETRSDMVSHKPGNRDTRGGFVHIGVIGRRILDRLGK